MGGTVACMQNFGHPNFNPHLHEPRDREAFAAFETQWARGDLANAATTLKALLASHPHDPRVQLYAAHLDRALGNEEIAEQAYRTLLRAAVSTAIHAEARQGLQALATAASQRRADAIAAEQAKPGGHDAACLLLQPVAAADVPALAAPFGRILQWDKLTAASKLPRRSPAILRTGTRADAIVLGRELQAIGLKAWVVALPDIAAIPLYAVNFFDLPPAGSDAPIRAACNCPPDPAALPFDPLSDELARSPAPPAAPATIDFAWEEVCQRVEGMVPTFGEVFDVDAKRRPIRKQQELDWIPVCDLHLKGRGILRLHDGLYRFHRGLAIAETAAPSRTSVRQRWEQVRQWVAEATPHVPVRKDFRAFADMALAFPEFLEQLPPRLAIERQEPSLWDNCFELFSGMAYLLGAVLPAPELVGVDSQRERAADG